MFQKKTAFVLRLFVWGGAFLMKSEVFEAGDTKEVWSIVYAVALQALMKMKQEL